MNEYYDLLSKKYLNGSGELKQDINPSNLEPIVEYKVMTLEEIKDAIESAYKAFDEWSSISPVKRGQILLKAGEIMEEEVDEYSKLITLEEGKTLKDSRAEVIRSYNTLKFYGALAMKYGGKSIPSSNENTTILTFKEPLGTVALITPWNFPLSIPVWKLAPALAAGDTVVLKPASKTPLIVAKLLETLEKAVLPNNVVKLAIGLGKEIGDQLVKDERIAAVSFTGSVPVGKGIYKAVGEKERMTRIQLELGGKNAIYIDESADIENAVRNTTILGAFGLTGQSCTATSRVLINRKIYDTFLKKLVEGVKKWKTGDGMLPDTDMGPVVDKNQYDIDVSYIESGINEGAKMIVGPKEIKHNSLFLEPVIFVDVTPDMRIFKEEIFGPILAVTEVNDLEEAITLTNSVPYGHTSGIMTTNIRNAMEYSRRVEAGVIKINRATIGLELQAPFGTFKASGATTWKEMGEEGLEFYLREKTIYLGW